MKLKQKLALNYIRARINILSLVSPAKAARKALTLFSTPQQRSGKKGPSLSQHAESLAFKLEGHTVRGHRWTPERPAHIPLRRALIVHGFESSSANFTDYVAALLAKHYEVLAFDAPGHGASGGKRITLPLYIKMLQGIEERYGPASAFLGHSFGGLALSHYLETREHELSTRLVLIAPAAEMTRAVDNFFQLLQLNAEVQKEFGELIYTLGGHPIEFYSMRRAMKQIHASCLWVQDEDDKVTPIDDMLPIRADAHPNLQFHITSGLGHRKIYRDPQVFEQIVAFF